MKITPEVRMFLHALDEQGVSRVSVFNAISVTTERIERNQMNERVHRTMRKVDRFLDAFYPEAAVPVMVKKERTK